ncbi:MAG: hypothetical protein D6732_04755 [Methanobacteriota archaeon]|nr:MAG: hypothetical protein D6732_04755 [Euryarchaeota archaeon]
MVDVNMNKIVSKPQLVGFSILFYALGCLLPILMIGGDILIFIGTDRWLIYLFALLGILCWLTMSHSFIRYLNDPIGHSVSFHSRVYFFMVPVLAALVGFHLLFLHEKLTNNDIYFAIVFLGANWALLTNFIYSDSQMKKSMPVNSFVEFAHMYWFYFLLILSFWFSLVFVSFWNEIWLLMGVSALFLLVNLYFWKNGYRLNRINLRYLIPANLVMIVLVVVEGYLPQLVGIDPVASLSIRSPKWAFAEVLVMAMLLITHRSKLQLLKEQGFDYWQLGCIFPEKGETMTPYFFQAKTGRKSIFLLIPDFFHQITKHDVVIFFQITNRDFPMSERSIIAINVDDDARAFCNENGIVLYQ